MVVKMSKESKLKIFLLALLWLFIAIVASISIVNKSEAKIVKCTGETGKVLIVKSMKQLTILDTSGCIIKQYDNIRIGKNPGPKQCDGDKRTPEGKYHIIEKRDSKYHRFLAINYPNADDIKKAKELGCKPGDSIGIHSWKPGLPKEGSLGCITVWSKKDILEIDSLVEVGTEVEIRK